MRYVMQYLATILIVLVTAPSWANERDAILKQAEALGAPMAAVRRAIEISRQPIFVKKDVLAVFDISKPSKEKRFTFWTSNQVRSPPITLPMANITDLVQKPLNSKGFRRIWTWCRWARLRPSMP